MEPPLPARPPDDPFGEAQRGPAYDVGGFEQGSTFSRWALARYIVGRVILERVSWTLGLFAGVLLVLAVLCQVLLHLTLLTVLLAIVLVMTLLLRWLLLFVLRRLMGAAHYGPLEERLGEIVDGAGKDVLAELRRVGLPSHLLTLPLIAFGLVGRQRRKRTMTKLRQFEVERAVSKARLDQLHMLLREATGSAQGNAA